MARIALDRPRIVRAALELLDEGGLGAVTARALGARLGVQAGALYHHLPDMRTLLDEAATQLLREMLAEPLAVDDWADLLRSMAGRMRRVLLRHRDGARVFAGSRITDAALLPAMEAPLSVLIAAGLPADQALWSMQSVLHFTVGFVIEEQHRAAEEPEAYRPEARLARIDAVASPRTAAATAAFLADADRQFAFGVQLLVDGVGARLAAARG